MATTRVALTASHVLEAVQLAEKGTEKLRDWSDVREEGLRIRVRGYKAVWLFRFKNATVTLGPANRWMPKQARELASHIRGMLRSGFDPRPWVDARLAGASDEEAAGVVLRREGKERKEWTMETLVQRYLEDHIKQGKVVRGVRRPPSAATARDVEAVLSSGPFIEIASLLARELDERTLEAFRDDMADEHGGSASRKALAYTKAALNWARRHHSAAAGLAGVSGWWRDVASIHVEKNKDRMPTVEDVGMTLALAEAFRRAPGRAINTEASGRTILGLWLLAFTVQRRAIVGVERRYLIGDDRHGEGWGILYVPPHLMKSRREHVLPIPPIAMQRLSSAVEVSREKGSRYLLPASRSGKVEADVPLHGAALNKLLARLRGRDEIGKARGAPDLLVQASVSVPDWSPHDLRRTFATIVEDETMRGDAVSAVLDHAQDGGRTPTQDAAAITRIAYSRAQRLPLKRIAMEPWCEAVEAAYQEALPKAEEIMASLAE